MAGDSQVLESNRAPKGLPGARLASRWWLILQVGATVALLAILVVWFSVWQRSQRIVAPRERSAEVGFARDMATHHAQAVNLATLLRDRSDDEEMRQLALDIMLTQQAQIGQMQGWLAVWGLPNVSLEPAMAWMEMP